MDLATALSRRRRGIARLGRHKSAVAGARTTPCGRGATHDPLQPKCPAPERGCGSISDRHGIQWCVPFGRYRMSHVNRNTVGRSRRTLDVAASMVLLPVVSPLLAGVAVAVKLTSRGPILFRQVRVGAGGRPFVLYKFRSMSTATSGPQVTCSDD